MEADQGPQRTRKSNIFLGLDLDFLDSLGPVVPKSPDPGETQTQKKTKDVQEIQSRLNSFTTSIRAGLGAFSPTSTSSLVRAKPSPRAAPAPPPPEKTKESEDDDDDDFAWDWDPTHDEPDVQEPESLPIKQEPVDRFNEPDDDFHWEVKQEAGVPELKVEVELEEGKGPARTRRTKKASKFSIKKDDTERLKNTPKLYICDFCGFIATVKHYLRTHITRVHIEYDKYVCPKCDKKFATRFRVERHLKTCKDSDPTKQHQSVICCETCGIFVRYHRRMDHCHFVKKQTYYCDYCGASRTTKKQLRSHIFRDHVPANAFPCPTCGKLFGSSVSLRAHSKKVHLEANPEMRAKKENMQGDCSICNKHVPNLKSHVAHHMMALKHKCPLCPKAFKTRAHLRQHKGTHTGDKNFKCRICGASYNFFSSLRNHEKKAHFELPAYEKPSEIRSFQPEFHPVHQYQF